MNLWKYSGTLLTVTGCIHTLVAFGLGWNTYVEMFQQGFIHSVGSDIQKSLALWFFICGILLLFWGQTLQYYINKEQQPAPRSLGYAILVFSIVGCLVDPVSGFWLFIPQAFIILLAKRKDIPNQ